MSSLISLLNGIVDYAGLFPPAALDMDHVVSNYSEYQNVSQSWMLGRLVVPALKLDEFEQAAENFLPMESAPWRISALVPSVSDNEKYQNAIQRIVEFNQQHSEVQNGLAIVDAVETRADQVDEIAAVHARMPEGIDVFFELPHQQDPQEWVQAIAAEQRVSFAKIRTGGVTPDGIPPADQVARFIARCAASDVGLKATAGLHHPIRSEFALTYETDAPRATMHGFINMFVAMAMAFEKGLGEQALADILSENSAANFDFSDQGICWKDESISTEAIERIRNEKAISFGSCSFVEPIQDLQQLGFGSSLAEAI